MPKPHIVFHVFYRDRKTESYYLSNGILHSWVGFFVFFLILYFLIKIINEKRNDLTRQRLTCYIYRHILPSNHIFSKRKRESEKASVVISRVHPKTQNAISSFYFICEKIYSTFCPFHQFIKIYKYRHKHTHTLLQQLRTAFSRICGACFFSRFAFILCWISILI